MTFRRGARLDPTQVRDIRGRRFAGGVALAGGGGVVGLILLVDCRIVGFVNSVQACWDETFTTADLDYEPALTYLYSDAVQSTCGFASAASGPCYCPVDASIYLDLTFFDEMRVRLGAQGGPLAEAYVVAHEYGHHVRSLLGVIGSGGRSGGAAGRSVRTELQADCYAGAWTANAADTGYLVPPTGTEIAVALHAAAAVGDDRIQRRASGRVNPETWTHGSSEQRQEWFLVGYELGDPDECDTFRESL
jgi:hypothetical protein